MKFATLFILSIVISFFTSNLANAQWVQTNTPSGCYVLCIAESSAGLFAGTREQGVFLSTDNGTKWTSVSTGLPLPPTVSALAVSGSKLFAGAYGVAGSPLDGALVSSNNGATWSLIDTGLTSNYVYSFAISGANTSTPILFAGTAEAGIFRSTDNGSHWTAVNTGLTNLTVQALVVSDSNDSSPMLFAGTWDGVFLSTNNGTSWTTSSTGLPSTRVSALTMRGTNASSTMLFAGIYGAGVFISTNKGTSWTEANTGLAGKYVAAFAVNGTSLFVGTDSGVFLTTNNATNWTRVNSGLLAVTGNPVVSALAISGKYLFAGIFPFGVWRRPLSEMSSVSNKEMSTTFNLNQNYPNPFNPSTEINFTLTQRSIVQLDVFDMLGRKIQTLANTTMDAGQHNATFNAGNLPSGIYTAQLSTNGGRREMKMILSK